MYIGSCKGVGDVLDADVVDGMNGFNIIADFAEYPRTFKNQDIFDK